MIRNGNSEHFTLRAGQVLRVTCDALSTAQVRRARSTQPGDDYPGAQACGAGATTTIGPYVNTASLWVDCLTGNATVEIADSDTLLDDTDPTVWSDELTPQHIKSLVASIPDDGSQFALSEIQPVVRLTASGSGKSGAGYYTGIKVVSISGGPITFTVYDNTSGAGTVIDTFAANAAKTWYWNRIDDTPTGGGPARRPFSTGCYVTASGGTFAIDVMVE